LRNCGLNGIKFRGQQPIGDYIVDFVSFENQLVIEIDGSQHEKTTGKLKDMGRSKWLESQGFRVLRFWDNDILNNLDGVLTRIGESLK